MVGTVTERAPSAPRKRRAVTVAIVAALLVAGLAARSAVGNGSESILVRWLPWMDHSRVTLYYGHPQDLGLVPVSRTIASDDAADVVSALLEGPEADTGLIALLPPDTALRTADLVDGVLSVDLAGDAEAIREPAVLQSVIRSLTSWPQADRLVLTIDGMAVDAGPLPRLLYFWDGSREMLVAIPTPAVSTAEMLADYLTGPPAPLIGLPGEVRLLHSELNQANGLLKLEFSFAESLREFALADEAGMRRVLEGLIATMTITDPVVDGVYLDFEGRSMLGLGGCADLLRSLQLAPKTLNDERLLARAAP